MRFVEQKDPDLWLDTAAEIATARPDMRFLIAGYGELQDRIVRRIASLGLVDRVAMPGASTDVGLIYAALDVILADVGDRGRAECPDRGSGLRSSRRRFGCRRRQRSNFAGQDRPRRPRTIATASG